MRITVEDRHINAGEPGCRSCPVAIALNEQAPLVEGWGWFVGFQGLYITQRSTELTLTVTSPPSPVKFWIGGWDSWKGGRAERPKPFVFDLHDHHVAAAKNLATRRAV